MLADTLIALFGLTITTVSLLFLSGRITAKRYSGVMTVAYGLAGVLCAVKGWTSVLYLTAGGTALFAWIWWHSGGGDGTRCRLKSWGRRFHGVRRTAPQGAS